MSGRSHSRVVGTNLMLAATLACLSYVPFEYVAKLSLIFAILLFIVDPIPPVSRLLSLLLVIVVAGISKLHRKYIQEEQVDLVDNDGDSNEEEEDDDDQAIAVDSENKDESNNISMAATMESDAASIATKLTNKKDN